jgi:hypothetical protein
VFILIVQLFMKVSWLKALAPTQTEGPFKLTPLVVIVAFVVPAVLQSIKSRGGQAHPASYPAAGPRSTISYLKLKSPAT